MRPLYKLFLVTAFTFLSTSFAVADQINLSMGDQITVGATVVSCGGKTGQCKNFGIDIYCGYGCENFGGNIYCAETPNGECKNFGGNIYCVNGGRATPAKPSHP